MANLVIFGGLGGWSEIGSDSRSLHVCPKLDRWELSHASRGEAAGGGRGGILCCLICHARMHVYMYHIQIKSSMQLLVPANRTRSGEASENNFDNTHPIWPQKIGHKMREVFELLGPIVRISSVNYQEGVHYRNHFPPSPNA